MDRKVVALLAATVAASVMAGCGLLGGPSVNLVIPKTIVVDTKAQVEGAYSEEKPGLEVEIHSKSSKRPLATSSTDRQGRFKFGFKATESGKQSFAVSITDGDRVTTSPYKTVNVLESSSVSISLVGGREAAVGDKRSVKGKVEPPGRARTVHLESSLDGRSWNQTRSITETSVDGAFEFKLNTSAAGSRYYLVKTEETAQLAEAYSGSQKLAVFDYEAAGKYYLKCVTPLNKKLEEFRQLVGLEAVKASALRMARRYNAQADCLRDYNWPPSIADDVDTLAANRDYDADNWALASKAKSPVEFNDILLAFVNDTASPARIRAILHLPRRPPTGPTA